MPDLDPVFFYTASLSAVITGLPPWLSTDWKGKATMVGLFLKWILSALALLVVTYIVPGFRVVNLPSALVAVLVIGFLNMTLGLILKAITLPFAILTFGLFFLVVNAIMLMIASKITPGLQIASFGAAFIGAVVLAIVHMVLDAVL
jgi:putative membrane protein